MKKKYRLKKMGKSNPKYIMHNKCIYNTCFISKERS